jgi:predicted transcriptional regulator
MHSAKQDAEAMIHALPDDATFEDMQYRLYVLEKIHLGLEDVDAGRTLPHDEVKAQLARWRDG